MQGRRERERELPFVQGLEPWLGALLSSVNVVGAAVAALAMTMAMAVAVVRRWLPVELRGSTLLPHWRCTKRGGSDGSGAALAKFA